MNNQILKVYLLRHGETSMNAEGNRYCGRTNVELTDKGLAQANEVAGQFEGIKFDAVYSSPLIRAFKTAEIASNGKVVIQDERLIEVDFGNWEGKTREEFIAKDPEVWNQWNLDPSNSAAGGIGETALEVIERVNSFFKEIKNQHPSGTILVVGHNGINRLYLAWKLSMELNKYRNIVQENSSITLFYLNEQHELQLHLLNSRIR